MVRIQIGVFLIFLFPDCFTHVNYDRDKIQIVVYTYIERAVSEGRNWKYVVVHTHMGEYRL